MQEKQLISETIADPRKRLMDRVSTCLLREPNYYETSDSKVKAILLDLSTVSEVDPEFVCQLACYARNSMNLRSISNLILAWADTVPSTKEFMKKYFNVTVKLPSDLLELVELNQKLKECSDRYHISNALQKCVASKFSEFNVYQLGKYCSEGRRKRLTLKNPNKSLTEKGNLSMKKLVRLSHASTPTSSIMCILGKRYPENPDVFANSPLCTDGEFNPNLANKRMKLETPVTWETELSAGGNKAETWENLVKSRKLPFMAMLRNLRNMLEVGVDAETHNIIIDRLKDPRQIEQSKLFPFRFFSAYEAIKIDIETLHKIKEDPEYQPPVTGKRGLKVKKNKKIPKEVPEPSLLQDYKAALDEAVKLATALNTSPIRGHSAIFVDVSGSMGCQVSGGNGLGSVRTCMEVGLILGLMLRHICESSEYLIFSSPGQTGKCWLPVDLKGEELLGQMKFLQEESRKLGGGTHFPYDYLEELISEHRKIDYWFLFSDMMVSPGNYEFPVGQWSISSMLDHYRQTVNPNMKFVTINLAGHGKNLLGADIDSDPNNIVISGYSDSILKMVSELDKSQVDEVREFALNLINK